jgi:hypothetical protein
MADEDKNVMDVDLDDLEDEEEVDDLEKDDEPDATAELQAKVDALTKEKDGIYKEMMSERKTRQELKSQMDNVAGLINELKIKKEAQTAKEDVETVNGIPVKFNEEGDPFIDPKDLMPVVEPTLNEVKQDVSSIKDNSQAQALELKNTEIINSVLQADPSYVAGFQKVQQAWTFLDKGLEDIIIQKGIDPASLTLDGALDIIEKSDVARQFSEQFPGLDIDLVVDANTRGPNGLVSGRKLRKAVKSATALSTDGKKQLNKLKFIASKPNNLASQSNQKGGGGRTLNDIAEINVDDFLNLSDADIAKLERALGAANA